MLLNDEGAVQPTAGISSLTQRLEGAAATQGRQLTSITKLPGQPAISPKQR